MSIAGLDDIAAKVIEGHALTDADAEALASTYDIVSLGMVADDARKTRHATRTTFLRVAHVPATPAPDQQASSPRSARELRVDAPFVDIEEASAAVRVFAPIPRHPGGEPTTGYEDVKAVALARILLADVPHIQADWTLHGPKLAQVALTFGADDMDNVSPLDEVAEGRRRAPLEEIRRNIRAAGFEAIERDPRFSFVG